MYNIHFSVLNEYGEIVCEKDFIGNHDDYTNYKNSLCEKYNPLDCIVFEELR